MALYKPNFLLLAACIKDKSLFYFLWPLILRLATSLIFTPLLVALNDHHLSRYYVKFGGCSSNGSDFITILVKNGKSITLGTMALLNVKRQ